MERRTFLKWATHGMGAIFGTALGLPAVAYLIDARNRPAPVGAFKPVARLSDLKVGVPQQAVIRDVRRDAWTLHPSDVIGRVWLLRREDNTVDAYTTICPHLGGSINYLPGPQCFLCPLHGARFALNGERLTTPGETNPAPRDMDELEVQLSNDPDPVVNVRYQTFVKGRHDKVPTA